ncbi:MAG TPA: hypothetical protein VJ989_04615 [Solirubrobacterales bacterium]|nr:hypothetical protein [Solirubrobacterales bacterium]
MPRRKRRKNARPRLEPLIDLNFLKALDHELRQHILLAALTDEVSPIGLSKSLGEALSQVSYHVKVLRDDCGGILLRTRTEQRRGALENFYRANLEALRPAESVAQIFALLDPEPAWDPAQLSALVDMLEDASKARREDK